MQVVDSEGYLKVKLIGGPAGPFVPYTGATTNVDLGEFELKAGQIELDQTPTGTAGVAVMRWNDTDGTADLGLKGGNVTLQIGQEQVTRVVNKTGTNLLEANYSAVRISGAQGNRIKVDLAQADNDANSADTLGLVTETINNNQEGFVTASGLVRNVNTTGSLQTETWLDGDVLYLSGTVAGRITNIKPTAPIHTVIMGYVIRAHATQGQIYVKVDNGYELDELHNVAITTPLNNQVLQYETATSLWKNKTISTGITIGTTAITSGTVGRVLFEGTGNVVQESANLFWDNTNGRLGIGTSSPAAPISLVSGTNINQLYPPDTTSGLVSYSLIPATFALSTYINRTTINSNSNLAVVLGSTAPVGSGTINSLHNLSIQNLYSNGLFSRNLDIATYGGSTTDNKFITMLLDDATNTDAAIRFRVNGWGNGAIMGISTRTGRSRQDFDFRVGYAATDLNTGTLAYRIFGATGNLAINTTTDAGFKFDCNGTSVFRGTLGLIATTAIQLAVTTNGNTRILSTNNDIILNAGSSTIEHSFGTYSIRKRMLTTYGDANANAGVAIGVDAVNVASAILSAESTTKGFLPPRMTTTQKNAIASPAAGLMVYDTTLNLISVYNGTIWISL